MGVVFKLQTHLDSCKRVDYYGMMGTPNNGREEFTIKTVSLFLSVTALLFLSRLDHDNTHRVSHIGHGRFCSDE